MITTEEQLREAEEARDALNEEVYHAESERNNIEEELGCALPKSDPRVIRLAALRHQFWDLEYDIERYYMAQDGI